MSKNLSIADVKRAQKVGGLEVLKNQYEDGRYYMSVAEAKHVDIRRAANGDGGYQRPLNQKRVAEIAESLKGVAKSDYPEVVIANVKGKLQCVDGQHRLLGHILANKECPVHVRSMDEQEAVNLFIRDNGKARALKRHDLFLASRDPLSKTIKELAADYGASPRQILGLIQGLKAVRTFVFDGSVELDERELRGITTVLDIWCRDPRFRGKTSQDLQDERAPEQARREYRDSIERSFSSPGIFVALGRLIKLNLQNLNVLKRDVRMLQEADWKKTNQSSLRVLARTCTGAAIAALWDVIERDVLLPGYKRHQL